jgi:tRNA(Ile)-lysidine synthase
MPPKPSMTRERKISGKWAVKKGVVGESLPRHRFHPAVLRWTEESRLGGPWCVAFSGGADSLALLLAVKAHWPERSWVALHFNHRLRGQSSDEDASFCREVCRALGMKYVIGRWRNPPKRASESDSRGARHAFFAKEMKRLRGRVLWLAQQQDDIAETLLMRLARGSGTGGLAAPRPVQRFADGRVYLRPLLTFRKTDLVAALREAGCAWREDETNGHPAFFRNRVRKTVLPAWSRAAGRDILAGAALARELMEEDDEALERWVDQLGALRRGVLDLGALQGMPRAVLRRAVYRWMLAVKPETDLSRRGFELLLLTAGQGRATRFSLGTADFAVIRDGKLSLQKSARFRIR